METGAAAMPATPVANLLKTRQHYEILDGLRGIAAIAVVIFHFFEWVYPDYTQSFIGHGFLAVDFFFCLSGFVIAYAYDGRMEKLGVKEFFISRIIRLHPLVILGSVLGLAAFLFDPFAEAAPAYSAGAIGLIFLLSLFMIPYPVMVERGFNLFGLNAPAWSLFWEYVANIVYGIVLWRLDKRILAAMTVIAAGCLAYVGYSADNLLGGWCGENFWQGGVRVAFSFLAGMVVYRYNFVIRNKLGFLGAGLLLLAALMMPGFGHAWLVEVLLVIFYFPLLIALGAGATPGPRMEKICNSLGKLSYPLYMTHYAVIWSFGNYYTRFKPDTTTLGWVIACSVGALIGFAYLVMVLYDTPLRRYLTNKRK